MSNSTLIRKATFDDIPAILHIEKRASPFPTTRPKIESELNYENAHVIVAEIDGRIVGYLDFWYIAPEIEIINIAVDPEFQKRGMAQYLFRHVFAAYPHSTAHLEVRPSNVAAQGLYKKLGFQVSQVRKQYYPDGEDAILMFWDHLK